MEMFQPILACALVLGLLVTVLALVTGRSLSKSPEGRANKEQGIPFLPQISRGRRGQLRESTGGAGFLVSGLAVNPFSKLGLKLRQWTRTSDRPEELSQVLHLALTPTHRLHLVRIRKSEVLLVTHPRGCDQLKLDIDPGAETTSEEGRA